MGILKEPVVVFCALFVLSLVAVYILFDFLKSKALIKAKGWEAGGAVAGFLIILSLGWYYLRPTLVAPPPDTGPSPLGMPFGFRPFTLKFQRIAIAVPQGWLEGGRTITAHLVSPDGQDDLWFSIQENFDPEFFTASNIKQTIREYKKWLPQAGLAFKFGEGSWGNPQVSSYQGHEGILVPYTLKIHGQQTEKRLCQIVFDESSRRIVTLMYSDTEVGRLISSTLSIPQLNQ